MQASVDAKGASHVDGAWPVEAKTNEVQDRTRLLRKLKNEDSYKQAVVSLSRGADVSVQQNNTIDLFEEYFTSEDHSHSYTPPSCKTVAVFRDPNEIKRSATKISWHPEGPNKLAVSYSIMQFQAAPPNMPIKSYIWVYISRVITVLIIISLMMMLHMRIYYRMLIVLMRPTLKFFHHLH